MKHLFTKFSTVVVLFSLMFIHVNAQNWTIAEGIPSDVSITSLQEYNGSIIAFGQRMWREGFQFFSEPKSYISEDNGLPLDVIVTPTGLLLLVFLTVVKSHLIYPSVQFDVSLKSFKV